MHTAIYPSDTSTAMVNTVMVAMVDTPTARPSRPSIMLTALVTPTIHTTVERHGKNTKIDQAAVAKRVHQGAHHHAAAHGDQRRHDLPGKFDQRFQRVDVIDDAQADDEHRAQQNGFVSGNRSGQRAKS